MDHNDPCLFCDKENQKFKLIAENDFCVARWDEFPVSLGHTLIIPKRHILSFFDLKDEEVVRIFSLIREAKEIIQKEYNPDGFNLGINDGVAAGRTIHHLHIHLIPRYKGDVEKPKGGVRHIIPGKGDYYDIISTMNDEKEIKKEEHYVCLGGCRGVSKVPGVCGAPDCVSHNHALVPCDCTDGLHHNFQKNTLQ